MSVGPRRRRRRQDNAVSSRIDGHKSKREKSSDRGFLFKSLNFDRRGPFPLSENSWNRCPAFYADLGQEFDASLDPKVELPDQTLPERHRLSPELFGSRYRDSCLFAKKNPSAGLILSGRRGQDLSVQTIERNASCRVPGIQRESFFVPVES
jgi:hypothetical protein